MCHAVTSFLLIFILRLGDVPIGTLRTMLMIQGRKSVVFGLAICESLIWLIAISRVISADTLSDPWRVAGYACGFATGTIVGMTLEQFLSIGTIIVRLISRHRGGEIREMLLAQNFGVTAVDGRGRDGAVLILFIVCPRRRLRELLATVEQIDPGAVVTHDAVTPAVGGFHGSRGRAALMTPPPQK